MKNSKIYAVDTKDQESRLQVLIDRSDKNDLVQCIRLISLYVSIYKKYFGELPTEIYEGLFQLDDNDAGSADIFKSGLSEAIAMMEMINKTSPGSLQYIRDRVTINQYLMLGIFFSVYADR